MLDISEYLSFWNKITPEQQDMLNHYAQKKDFKSGTIIHRGADDCIGLVVVVSGRLRVYTLSDEGRELTIYRLFERDMCLFSASCMMRNIQFDVMVEAETDAQVLYIPAEIYKKLLAESLVISNYTNELMAAKFTDVMWLMDQVLNKKLDSRLAAFLLNECELADSKELRITHEKLAHHLGSVREVVTRMLKYFQNEDMVRLTRGSITILNESKLEELAVVSRR